MVRITAADLRRLNAARVSKYAETDVGVMLEFFPPAAVVATAPAKPAPAEPEEPTPDEWLRQQYKQPDGT